MTATPTMPSATATTRAAPRRSPRKVTASSAVQIGIVNSIATTCAIGISVSAKNQPNCAAVVDGVARDLLAEAARCASP